MRFDTWDTPKVASERVNVGPASQLPVSGTAPGRQIAEGIDSIGMGVKQYTAERDRAEQYVAADREVRFAEEVQGVLRGSKDPITGEATPGFLSEQGERALDTAGVKEKIEALRQKYAAGLNPKALASYERRTRVRALSYSETIEVHAAGQRRQLYEATVANMVEGAKNDALLNYSDPKKIEEQLTLATPLLVTYLRDDLRLSGPVIEKKVREFEADVYGEVLKKYRANKQPQAGKAYLELIKDKLGPKAVDWEAHFNDLSEAQETERLSTEAWSVLEDQATDSVTGRFNDDLARSALVELYEPAARAKIESEIERSIAVKVAGQREADVQRLARLERGVRATGKLDKQSVDFLNLDDRGKDAAEAMVETRQRVLRSDKAEARREQAALDSIAESKFYQIPSIEERAALTPAQVEANYPYASPKQREEIKAHVVAAQIITKKRQQANYKEMITQVNEVKKALPDKRAAVFAQKLQAWYDAQVLADKIPTDAEVSQRINNMVISYDTWGSDSYGFELEDTAGLDVAENQPVARARNALARPNAPTKPAPQVRTLPPPKPGKVWVERDGQVGQVSETSVRSTDKRIK
jgi:hypothetical protein